MHFTQAHLLPIVAFCFTTSFPPTAQSNCRTDEFIPTAEMHSYKITIYGTFALRSSFWCLSQCAIDLNKCHICSLSFISPTDLAFPDKPLSKSSPFFLSFFFFPPPSQSPESAHGFHVFQCSITLHCLLGLKPCLWMCFYHTVHEYSTILGNIAVLTHL